ncbi:MAG: zinc-dependent metalloprotease [Pseudomonadales bacterium]
MRNLVLSIVRLGSTAACNGPPAGDSGDLFDRLDSFEHLPGFYDLYWGESTGQLLIDIGNMAEPFLYQASLARGIGSNDLGLDRGQLGTTAVVEFQRSGPKILLVQHNLDYRALTDDPAELNAVDESFARSVIWGFEVLGERGGSVLIDATEFLIRDAHRITARLAGSEEGTFMPDASRSAIYMPNTRAFPDNSEVEAIVTFTGQATGPWLPTVTPDAESFTVHLHHSFIRLPDDDYEPLAFDPRSGFFGRDFQDYASPVGDPLRVVYTNRHRLEKTDPDAAVSEAVEPIVYYVDHGAPEPIRTALIEGAAWWNQAFEAAGYKDTFQVKVLPEDVDPMDVRYNVIQWVHRSTRGWSYGGGIFDPRTGEIMKGKVTLGSLRVRQNYLIAEALLGPYDGEEKPDAMMEMALARIRQLAAHEVGHTLGLGHNMAASTQGRASVMDYPYPLIKFDEDGDLDLSDAYDDGIGEWDKRAILHGYQNFPEGTDELAARGRIMADTIESGLVYVDDKDARSIGSAHPLGSLWDNGADSIEELNHLLRVRAHALARFSENNIRPGQSMATLEEVLVPLYLLHRFQLNAVGKLIGGYEFSYAMRGDGQKIGDPVSPDRQREAIAALINTLSPAVLRVPQHVLDLIPPRPPGIPKTRETFPAVTGTVFEPFGAAQSAVSLTLDVLFEPNRAARLIALSARSAISPGFDELLDDLLRVTWFAAQQLGIDAELQRITSSLMLDRLMLLTTNNEAATQVRAIALDAVNRLDNWLAQQTSSERATAWRAHYGFARLRIEQMRSDPSSLEQIAPVTVPPGEPIG